MADIINAQNYASVEIWDAHSDVTVACLDRCIHVPASKFVSRFARGDMVFVAPDAGAKKKVEECARVVGATMIEAGKTRNVMTGEITGTIVHSDKHIGERDFLIIDDICDGGRTFLELAKLLRTLTAGKIKLYVTHGIFSKGTHIFDGLIDKIYVANPFPGTMEITRV